MIIAYHTLHHGLEAYLNRNHGAVNQRFFEILKNRVRKHLLAALIGYKRESADLTQRGGVFYEKADFIIVGCSYVNDFSVVLNGDKSTYQQKLISTRNDSKSGGMHDRSYFYGEDNTIFWSDFIKMLHLEITATDMSAFLNKRFTQKAPDGTLEEDITEFAYIARSIIKLQNLGVLQCDFITTLGTISPNNIERFHITFFGQKLLEYISLEEMNKQWDKE